MSQLPIWAWDRKAKKYVVLPNLPWVYLEDGRMALPGITMLQHGLSSVDFYARFGDRFTYSINQDLLIYLPPEARQDHKA